MQLDPHVAIAAVGTLAAGWLMISAGFQKRALELSSSTARLSLLR
jgi:hypothetical protein